ncbi:hypothetical protein [Myroides odoratus]|uniref:hypothetical protein n=1 Tax=Myroides odoratus TaxID=256 RepID=UPI0009E89B23|nr:hypothetical protein [Myroides odoratus]
MPLELELFSFYNVKARKDCELLNPIPEIPLCKVKDVPNEIRSSPIGYKMFVHRKNKRRRNN